MDSSPVASFVNRVDELAFIRDKLAAIKEGSWLFDFLLSVKGIPGIGKTTLLDQVAEEARASQVRVIHINYTPVDNQDEHETFALQQVAKALFPDSTEWAAMLQTYLMSAPEVQEAELRQKLIDTFVKQCQGVLSKTPALWLIDDSHYLSEVAQKILEAVLERLLAKNRLFVILAGRVEIGWYSFELRRRTRLITLEAFPKQEAEKLLPDPIRTAVSDQIYSLTHGYPRASVLAHEWITENLRPAASNLDRQLKKQEASLVFSLVETILKTHILADIPDPEQRRNLNHLLKLISPLRRFDDNLLYAFLTDLEPDRFAGINALTTRTYIRQLATSTYLVKWESAKFAYALDYPIRSLLSLNMKFGDDQKLLAIHQFALAWYEQLIIQLAERDPSTPQSVTYLMEHIFHLAWVQLLQNKPKTLKKKIKQTIELHLERYKHPECNQFFEEFSKDEELAEVLGPSYPALVQFVEQLVEQKAVDEAQK